MKTDILIFEGIMPLCIRCDIWVVGVDDKMRRRQCLNSILSCGVLLTPGRTFYNVLIHTVSDWYGSQIHALNYETCNGKDTDIENDFFNAFTNRILIICFLFFFCLFQRLNFQLQDLFIPYLIHGVSIYDIGSDSCYVLNKFHSAL